MRGVMETQCWYDDVPLSDCSHAGLHKAVINQDAALQAAEAEREQSEIRCRSVGGEFEATLIELINVKSALRRVGEALRGTGERVYADGSVCWCDEDDQGDHAPHCRTARAALADPVVQRVREKA